MVDTRAAVVIARRVNGVVVRFQEGGEEYARVSNALNVPPPIGARVLVAGTGRQRYIIGRRR